MDLRHLENIVIDQAILHVLDMQMDAPLLGSVGLDIDSEEVLEFITKHVLKALQDDSAFKAKFLPGTIMISHAQELIEGEDFLGTSNIVAKRLFDLLKSHQEPSCDVLIFRFHSGNLPCFGLLKLDFQKSYTHEIDFQEDSFQINLVSQEISLPTQQQKVNQCCFGIMPTVEGEYDVIVLNKKRSSDEDEKSRFVKTFLNATREFDYKDKTKTLKKTVEDWTQKHLKEDFDTASDLRRALEEKLRTHAVVSADELVKDALAHDTNARHALKLKLEQEGIQSDERFEIDKRFVDKKMKSKTIRTDTGFVIRGDYELFQDDGFIEIQRNGDGTVNYLIKHVRCVKES